MLLKVTAICGSLREGSYTRKALRMACQAAADSGANIAFIDLRDVDFPIRNPDAHIYENPETYPDGIRKLQPAIREAHAFLVGTPEYHGSYSGALKAFLDYFDVPDFEGKLVGLVAADGWHAFDHLRIVFRNLRAWVLPRQVAVDESNFDALGTLVDSDVIERLTRLGHELVHYTKAIGIPGIDCTNEYLQCRCLD